jgi:hypothetical protein
LTQPWATLVAVGENSIETRSWGTSYRGPLSIHSAKGFPRDARELCRMSPYREVLTRHGYADALSLPLGAVIAVAELVDVMKFTRGTLRDVRTRAKSRELPPHEADFGDFSPGRYGWVLKDVRALREPVPARGMLGLWEVSEETQARINRQLPNPTTSIAEPSWH